MDRGDYDVGRGKPPVHSRFKPGQSGNPAGRPKRPPSIESLVERELEREIQVMIGGQSVTMTNREKVARALVMQMGRGEMRPIEWFAKRRDRLDTLPTLDADEPTDAPPPN